MRKHRNPPGIPLPARWSQRARSAMLHVISLAQFALAYTRGWAANSQVARVRLRAANDRLRQQVALLTEEVRIKDARMKRMASQRRPHYVPTERMTILELRAARAWSLQQTADAFLVTATTISSWMRRLDEDGPGALVRIHEPINKFPDFGVQGEAVSEMRVGLSWPGDRTRPQTSPNCGGQESSWEASGAKGAA